MSLLTRTTLPTQRSAPPLEAAPAEAAGSTPAPAQGPHRRPQLALAGAGLVVAGLVAGGVVLLDGDGGADGTGGRSGSGAQTTEWVPAYPDGDPALGAPAGGWVPAGEAAAPAALPPAAAGSADSGRTPLDSPPMLGARPHP